MRYITILSLIVFVMTSSFECNKNKRSAECFKGKLVINGICRQLVVKVIEGNPDTSRIVSSWQDPSDNRVYENVFTVANVCTFPADYSEGQEFYFSFDDTPPAQDCAVCLALRITPAKRQSVLICHNQ